MNALVSLAAQLASNPDTPAVFHPVSVVSVEGATVTVDWYGTTVADVDRLASYSPAAGDRAVVVVQGEWLLAIGKVA